MSSAKHSPVPPLPPWGRIFNPSLRATQNTHYTLDETEPLNNHRSRHRVWNILCWVNVAYKNQANPGDKSLFLASKTQRVFKRLKTYLVWKTGKRIYPKQKKMFIISKKKDRVHLFDVRKMLSGHSILQIKRECSHLKNCTPKIYIKYTFGI